MASGETIARYPPTPPFLYPSHSNRADVTQSINTGRKSSPAENKISHGEEQRPVATESKSPYNQARIYVEHFNCWYKAKTFSSLNSYEVGSFEEPFSLKMSFNDWMKLSDDLDILKLIKSLESHSEILRYFANTLQISKVCI